MNTRPSPFLEATLAPAFAPVNLPSPRQHILVVDDDCYVRELNAGVLIRSGYQVDTAANGLDAWRALHADQYDLLITEEQMPWVSGLELIQRLRAEAMLLPVILASGLPPLNEWNQPPGLHIQAMVTKPCSLALLLKTVRTVLAGTEAHPASPGQPDINR